MAPERLQKVLATAGVASRRASETLIREGRVKVDGRPAVLGEQVDPLTQAIEVDGRRVAAAPGPRAYWLMNKPAGVVSTVKDRHAERTVLQLLPREALADARRLYPVGRLDQDSEGLLLLTNDGDWAELLLHPRYGVEREYMVGLDRSVTKTQRVALKAGVELEEGLARLDRFEDATAAEVRRLHEIVEPASDQLRWYRVVLAQGWRRQIRRMFESVGAPARRLVRVRVGTLRLSDLPPGESRPLRRREVAQLTSSARAVPKPGATWPVRSPAATGPAAADESGSGPAAAAPQDGRG